MATDVKTDIEQFKLFHECITKNNPEYSPFYIPLNIKSKDPLPDISWEKSHATYEQAIKYLMLGHNIGIVARKNDRLVIMDKDDINAVGVTKPTLTVTSRKRYGEHGFYFTDDTISTDLYQDSAKQNIATENYGEIRANEEYVVCAGSYVPVDKDEIDDAGVRTWDKVPETEKVNAGKYTIHELNPVNIITFSELPGVYVDALKSRRKAEAEAEKNKENKTEHKDYHPPQNENKKSSLWDLTIGDVTGKNEDGSHRFPSLFHGSATGMNTSVNNGLMQCWRHSVSHTPLTALAILAGLGTCSSLGHVFHGRNGSSLDLKDGETQFKLWEYAKNNGLISKEDPIPSKALVWYALNNNLCDKSAVIDGWKLPTDIYNKAIGLLDSSKIPPGRKAYSETKTETSQDNGDSNGKTCGNCKYKPVRDVGNCRHPYYKTEGVKPHYTEDINTACKKWIVKPITKTGKKPDEINIVDIAEQVLAKHPIFSMVDNPDEMYYYDAGVYKKGAQVKIRAVAQKILDENSSKYSINEVIFYIQNATFIERTEINKEKHIINLKNGLYNVDTKTFEKHRPTLLSTCQLPVKYNPKAKCPKISRFLCEILRPEDIATVLQEIGYSLIPDYTIQKAFLWDGSGLNGKGALGRLITALIGLNNKSSVSLQALNTNIFAAASLYGKLINMHMDLPATTIRDDSVFKLLTGGDGVEVQYKFGQPFTLDNYARLFFGCNDVPQHPNGGDAWNRRWILTGFPCKFDGIDDNKNLDKELQTSEELSGFLNLCLEALHWLLETKTFFDQKTMDEVGEEYLIKSNSVMAFMKECTSPADHFEITDDLYKAYGRWGKIKKIKKIVASNKFGGFLQNGGYEHDRPYLNGKYRYIYHGIILDNAKIDEMEKTTQLIPEQEAYTHWYTKSRKQENTDKTNQDATTSKKQISWVLWVDPQILLSEILYICKNNKKFNYSGLIKNLRINYLGTNPEYSEYKENIDNKPTREEHAGLNRVATDNCNGTKPISDKHAELNPVKSEEERKKEDDITYTIFKAKDWYDDVHQMTKESWDYLLKDVMSCRNRPMPEAVEIVKCARIKMGAT